MGDDKVLQGWCSSAEIRLRLAMKCDVEYRCGGLVLVKNLQPVVEVKLKSGQRGMADLELFPLVRTTMNRALY
jgi:hypothetical protein